MKNISAVILSLSISILTGYMFPAYLHADDISPDLKPDAAVKEEQTAPAAEESGSNGVIIYRWDAMEEKTAEGADTAAEDRAPSPKPGLQGQDMEAFLKSLVLEPGASCVSEKCHADLGQKKYIHAIGVDGMKCGRCHEITIESRHEFKKIPPETMYLCAACHRADVLPPEGLEKTPPRVIAEDEAKILHTPFREGKCTACHDPHSSDYYKHLKHPYPAGSYARYEAGIYGLCSGDCHKELEKKLTEPRTLSLTMFRNGNVNLHYRHVNKEKGRTCSICHHPHGDKKPKLIKDTFLFGKRMLTIDFEKTETGGECLTTCHRVAKYDRYKPEFNFIKTSPLPGEDAATEELEQSRTDDERRLREKERKKENINLPMEER